MRNSRPACKSDTVVRKFKCNYAKLYAHDRTESNDVTHTLTTYATHRTEAKNTGEKDMSFVSLARVGIVHNVRLPTILHKKEQKRFLENAHVKYNEYKNA